MILKETLTHIMEHYLLVSNMIHEHILTLPLFGMTLLVVRHTSMPQAMLEIVVRFGKYHLMVRQQAQTMAHYFQTFLVQL